MALDFEAKAHLVNRVPRTHARQAVVEQLLSLLRSGAYGPGDRLPPEPELMRLTGVGRSTIREAIRGLASMQLVEVQPGRGTFVSSGSSQSLDDPKMLLLLSDRQAVVDLIEARTLIEPHIARLAAERATTEDVDAIRAALADQGRASDHAAWREAHLTFHEALARATHNLVLTRMWASIATFLRNSPLISPAQPSTWDSVGRALHERIYETIAARDVAAAVAAMDEHVADMTGFLGRASGGKPDSPEG